MCSSPGLEEELDLLQNVYMEEEISVHRSDCSSEVDHILMNIHPATAGNVDEQYVCIRLYVELPESYPEESPVFKIRNPRGLSEQDVNSLQECIVEFLRSEIGSPILMQLFELVREQITGRNVPTGICSICLSNFVDEGRQFIRTDCYHYFHKSCINSYIEHALTNKDPEEETLPNHIQEKSDAQGILCPECRCPISRQPSNEACADIERKEEDFVYRPDDRMIRLQAYWQRIYDKQKAQGGIIDIEAERSKFRLPPPPEPVAESTAAVADESTSQQAPVYTTQDCKQAPATDDRISAIPQEEKTSNLYVANNNTNIEKVQTESETTSSNHTEAKTSSSNQTEVKPKSAHNSRSHPTHHDHHRHHRSYRSHDNRQIYYSGHKHHNGHDGSRQRSSNKPHLHKPDKRNTNTSFPASATEPDAQSEDVKKQSHEPATDREATENPKDNTGHSHNNYRGDWRGQGRGRGHYHRGERGHHGAFRGRYREEKTGNHQQKQQLTPES